MNRKDAFAILNIKAERTTAEEIKAAYKEALTKYFLSNPAGFEMMKFIEAAYQTLKDYSGIVETYDTPSDYGSELNNALNAIINCELQIEICGAWIWVSDDTKTHYTTLKEAGYLWSPSKNRWFFRPAEYASKASQGWTMDEIRSRYGGAPISPNS